MRKTIVLSVVAVLIVLALSTAWVAFADSSPLSVAKELQTNLQGTFGYSVYQLADGSLVLNTANGTCTFLVKTRPIKPSGMVKANPIDPANTTLPRLRPTADGGFVVAGIMDNLYTVVKTDSEGNIAVEPEIQFRSTHKLLPIHHPNPRRRLRHSRLRTISRRRLRLDLVLLSKPTPLETWNGTGRFRDRWPIVRQVSSKPQMAATSCQT